MIGRIRVLFILFSLAWLVLIARLFYWQVIKSSQLTSDAKLQQEAYAELSTPRGQILTSDNSSLTISTQKFLLFIQPSFIYKNLKDVNNFGQKNEEIYQRLSQYLSLDKEKFFKIADDKKIQWYPLKKDLNLTTKEKIEKETLLGIGFDAYWQRSYPEASMAAHLLGFVGTDEAGKEKGYYGLEGYYDRELKGIAGEKSWEQDLFGRSIVIGKSQEKKSKSGRDLYLSLNRAVQFLVEKNLKNGIEKYQAVSGTVVVLDPQSGGVIAMASFPGYDQTNIAGENKENFSNPAVSFSFEPGSVFKPIVMAAALDLGLVRPETICNICAGPIQIGEYSIKTWNEKYFPQTTMTEVILHSDNTGMVFVSQKLGVKNIFEYLKRFGFGEISGIDLQEESSPKLRETDSWTEIDLATAGFGQGIAVTPIQITRAMAAIANGGKLVNPKVVEKIKDGEKIILAKTGEKKQVIRPVTAKIITEMMVNAVEKGEAGKNKPKGYKIAGKTGTAQIPIAGHYDENKTMASFIGFAPADDPKFVMLVTLREPKTSPWGTTTAAPIWFDIAKEIFRVWGIPPS